jgi:glycosyltransferase involved in cell wall biosynthesis
VKAWFWFNEYAAARAGHHLIADHPEIARHLQRHTRASRITVIPYGAEPVNSASEDLIAPYGLASGRYDLVIARFEPENSILEIVQAFSQRPRSVPLIILGRRPSAASAFERCVLGAAGPQVRFLGTIYERPVVRALRFHARLYLHGHTVGGTNPTLVESLAAGKPILAHDNRFNRWVAGPEAAYFRDASSLSGLLDQFDADPRRLDGMAEGSRARHNQAFQPQQILSAYEEVLLRFDRASPTHSRG